MADQDHGLDDVRELARGLRENENSGETLQSLRSQLAAAREELEAAERDRKETVEMWNRASDDCIAQTKRADRAEAALERVREWARDYPITDSSDWGEYIKAQHHVEALIEHGPDDGKPVRVHGWATDATHGTEVTIEPDGGERVQHYAPGVAADLGHPEADDPPPEFDDGESEQKGCTCSKEAQGLMHPWPRRRDTDPDCPVHGESEQKGEGDATDRP